ncbi:elongation factor 1-delta-like isoform X5 [Schistocerca cancellata]|uniref:elongation factor 1-delta-like isoform X5 n=1 Tax=Schistocerca cancellata TaxID=274614 RepID=UPI002117C048|nr:elongation factor 1-delta-like isoform X5 [Schistocerca cancellata]
MVVVSGNVLIVKKADMTSPLVHEKIWFEKFRYDEAERQYFEKLSKMDGIAALATNVNVELVNRLNSLEKSNTELNSLVKDLQAVIKQLDSRVKVLETNSNKPSHTTTVAPAPTQEKTVDDNDDGVDLFGSDSEEESEEAKKIKEQRLAEYAAKKSKKPALIAKSNIILDVKPWDDETDMKLLEAEVRKISMDGLLWGASKLVPLAYGIHKLQISCVVEDDKVSVDVLQEAIEAIEDYVQSVDIAAFNKV